MLMDIEKAIENGINPYGLTLAKNIQHVFPTIRAIYGFGNIYLHLNEDIGHKADLKGWLYTMLDTLPEIEYPLERIEFIIYVNGSIKLFKVINPSEFDAMAIDKAIIDGLNFSSPPESGWNKPMPLDHPWYTDKDYFRKNGYVKDYAIKKKHPEAHLFNQIKDMPNVKIILDQIKKDGLST